MTYLINVATLLVFFIGMEMVAYLSHKYIMHGFMWRWHESHHRIRHGIFERNDLFGLIFAVPSIWLTMAGAGNYDWRFFAGLGIALYGLAYFLVHDVFVHQRIRWFRKTGVPYFRAMRRTHHLHHAVHTKSGAEAFGFLFVPRRYFRRYSRG